jgi:hypothetical protein
MPMTANICKGNRLLYNEENFIMLNQVLEFYYCVLPLDSCETILDEKAKEILDNTCSLNLCLHLDLS